MKNVEPDKINDHFPTGEFIDGMLGLTDKNIIMDKLSKLNNNNNNNRLFEDDEFPADSSSVCFYNLPQELSDGGVKWLRPHEITKTPFLFVDGTNRRDVKQGILGDYYYYYYYYVFLHD